MTKAVTTSLDGRTLTMESRRLDLSFRPTNVGVVRLPDRLVEFNASTIEFGRTVARELAQVRLEESFRLQGGRLWIGSTQQVISPAGHVSHIRMGLWEARHWCLWTHLNGPSSTDDLIGLFNSFTLTEVDAGVVMTSLDPSTVAFEEPSSVMKVVPQMGLLEVSPLTPRLRSTLPAQRGTRTLGGQIYVDEPVDGELNRMHFVLVSRSAFTSVTPSAVAAASAAGEHDLSRDQLANRALLAMQDLTVDWVS